MALSSVIIAGVLHGVALSWAAWGPNWTIPGFPPWFGRLFVAMLLLNWGTWYLWPG